MAENLNLNVNVDTSTANASVGSLKKQLREAQQEVMSLADKFGATSKEAINAAKRAAELKDRIGDAKALTDAYNPDQKFKAVTASLSGLAGGFGAVQGAMALFGVESDDVQKTLLKVQSAMAISQGLNAVGDSIDSFKTLGKQVASSTVFIKANEMANKATAFTMKALGMATETTTTSFKVMKTAIAATGIGLLVIGIGEVVSALSSFASSAEDAAAAQKELNKTIQDGADAALEGGKTYIDRQSKLEVAQAKSAGKSAREIYEIDKKWRQQRIDSLLRHYDDVVSIDAIAAKKSADEIKKIKIDDEVAKLELEGQERKDLADKEKEKSDIAKQTALEKKKEAIALAKEMAAAELEASKKLIDLKNQIEVLGIEDEYKAKRKSIEQNLKKEIDEVNANEKLKIETKNAIIAQLELKAKLDTEAANKEEQKDKLKKEEEFQKELEKVKLEIKLAGIQDEYDKSKAQIESNYQLQFEDIDKNETYTAEQKLALKLALQQKENQELDKLKLDTDKKKMSDDIAELDKEIAKNSTKFDIERGLLDKKDLLLKESFDRNLINEKEYNAGVEANAKARADIDKAETQAKIENAQKISGLLSGLADVVGKETAAGKAFAIASATIDTYLAATKAYQSMSGIPIVGPALGAVAAGVAIAGGIKNVKAIMAVKTPSGGGGSSPSLPNVSTSAPMTPQAPTAQTTNISQQSINQLGNQAVKAYVIESDVTGSQQRMEAIRQRARFS
jgi:hypothetical protein